MPPNASYTDCKKLAAAIRARSHSSGLVVGVEGASGSGKTQLAELLASQLNGAPISTDAHYKAGVVRDRYHDGLRLDALTRAIRDLQSGGAPIVIEGICLRDTLAAIHVTPTVFVYTKRISGAGIWHDDPALFDLSDIDDASTQGHIDRWSQSYHCRVEPHVLADFVYEWNEEVNSREDS
jgi:hypothetical protein